MRPENTALRMGLEAFLRFLPAGLHVAEIGCYAGESTRIDGGERGESGRPGRRVHDDVGPLDRVGQGRDREVELL